MPASTPPPAPVGLRRPRPRGRGFTLIELLTVVAVVGVIATMAVPNIVGLVQVAEANRSFQQVSNAIQSARGYAQKYNTPVVLKLNTTGVTLTKGDFGSPPYGFLLLTADWTVPVSTFEFPDGVKIDSSGDLVAGDVLAFCPSADYRFVDLSGAIAPGGAGTPVCGLSNMASKGGQLKLTYRDRTRTLLIGTALASIELKTSS